MTAENRQAIREAMWQKRRALKDVEQLRAKQMLVEKIIESPFFEQNFHFAFYQANNGEMDPCLAMAQAAQSDKINYLPVLCPDKYRQLCFVKYQQGAELQPNQYGILEPIFTADNIIDPNQLDIVFMPLVAFDEAGNRLGMGKGYYDRTFEFLKNNPKDAPLLVGLAHEFQRVDALQSESWDIPMHAVITDEAIYHCQGR